MMTNKKEMSNKTRITNLQRLIREGKELGFSRVLLKKYALELVELIKKREADKKKEQGFYKIISSAKVKPVLENVKETKELNPLVCFSVIGENKYREQIRERIQKDTKKAKQSDLRIRSITRKENQLQERLVTELNSN